MKAVYVATIVLVGVAPAALAVETQEEDFSRAGDGDMWRTDAWVHLDASAISTAIAEGRVVELDLGVAQFSVEMRPDDSINSGEFGYIDIDTYEKTIMPMPGVSYVGHLMNGRGDVTLTITNTAVRGSVVDGKTYYIQPAYEVTTADDPSLHLVTVFNTPPLLTMDMLSAAETLLGSATPASHTAKSAHIIFIGDKSYCDNVADAGSRMQAAMNDLSISYQYISVARSNGGIWCLTGDLGGSDNNARLTNFRNWGQGFNDHREAAQLWTYQTCSCSGLAYGGDGVAFVGKDWGYSIWYQRAFSDVNPNYSYHRAIISAHESGHTFGAGHSYQQTCLQYYQGSCISWAYGVNASGQAMASITLWFSGQSHNWVQNSGYTQIPH